ncbi:ACP phosphodiesterase [Vibrio hippocampi]|uniref:Acyl carrier protein phosphodiesterase n=1 Tax=Vibrio hippocampi TaxID=654686 RepID=A0ABN8DIL0_9VIBR|nr:ACP phosphodiesterase [Vibrio hippocampi]CAH0528897.1 Acyl carrier protein phosphodiesterase [Vibrio hippocampi]
MNFLAHLHIAHHCHSDLMGNLLGDFVKGNPDTQFVPPIANGIRLHRYVDSFTDAHPMVKQCKSQFSAPHRRFAGIALDMFWDHCLARYWHRFHPHSLEQFVLSAQARVLSQQAATDDLPDRFVTVSTSMWQQDWLLSYQEFDNIHYALKRMSQRSARMAPLALCFSDLERHYSDFSTQFITWYPTLLAESARYHAQLIEVKAFDAD